MSRRRTLTATALIIGLLGAWQIASGGWIYAKAALAKGMIADAWTETLSTGIKIKPWPWADTWPVAKLRSPTHKRDITVLAGAQGTTLAFGAVPSRWHRQTGRAGQQRHRRSSRYQLHLAQLSQTRRPGQRAE